MFRRNVLFLLLGVFVFNAQIFSCCEQVKKDDAKFAIEKCEELIKACCEKKECEELTKSLPNFEELFTQITTALNDLLAANGINVAEIAALAASLLGVQTTIAEMEAAIALLQSQMSCVAAYVGASAECGIPVPTP